MSRKYLSKSSARFLVFAFAELWLGSAILMAQIGGTGRIQGTVADSSRAVIPDAEVVAISAATGIKTTTVTTGTGLYVLSPLRPGAYTVSVSRPGFKTRVQEGVIVDASSVVSLDLQLEVGETTQEVTVTAEAAQLDTNDARLGQTMRNDLYTALPLAMSGAPRDPQAFASLNAGFQTGGRFGTINGGQSFSKENFVEGVPLTDAVQQGEGRPIGLGISVEAVEQFQLEGSGAGVEFSGQGSENYQVKSGTNQFHGSLFEHFRNTKLDARGFFNSTRPPENQNEFGATFGGPIKQNKLFFFVDYDGFRFRQATAARFITVPTQKMKLGDFSQLPVPIFDPLTTNCSSGKCTRQPFPNNVIPEDRISPISKALIEGLPDPNGSGLSSNFLNNNKGGGFDNNEGLAKVDFKATDHHALSFLFSRGVREQASAIRGNPPPLPLPFVDTRVVSEKTIVAQVKHTWSITPNLLNQVSLGYTRLFVPITNPTAVKGRLAKLGLKGLPAGDATDSFPETSFSGPNSPQNFRGTDSRPFLDALNNVTIQDSLQWIHGNHTFKFGYQHQRLGDNFRNRNDGTLYIQRFSNTETAGFDGKGTLLTGTGHSFASFLLGAVDSATVIQDQFVTTGARFRNHAFWAQDDWKVSSRLTLNLGLRWDIMLPFKEVLDRVSFLNPDLPNPAIGGAPGALQFGGSGESPLFCNCGSTRVDTYLKALGPNIGFAYKLTDKTVLRTGYNIKYSRAGAVGGRAGARDGTGTLGFTASPGLTSLDGGISPAFFLDKGIPPFQKPPFLNPTLNTGFTTENPSGGSVTLDTADRAGRPPRIQNWNFSVQRALTSAMALTVAYVGSKGDRLRDGPLGPSSNDIDPKYLALGNLLRASATPQNIAQAQQILPDVRLPFANFKGTIGQALRPFPQFSGVSAPFLLTGSSSYNALQVTLLQRMSAGLTFNANYTWSKTLTNTQGRRSQYLGALDRTLGETDRTHVFNFFFVGELPFGNRKALSPGNSLLRALVSGYRVSGITKIESGLPLGAITANCNVPFAGSCVADFNPDFSGSVRINGDVGSGDILGSKPPVFLDKNAFRNPAPFTFGNTPRKAAFGLRNPTFWNQDLSVSRRFHLKERLGLVAQIDAFNVFNTVIFNGPTVGNINSSNFGRVTGQENSARALQVVMKLTF